MAGGAFGSHGLRERIESELLRAFDTGASYQLVPALALLAVAWAAGRWPAARLRMVGWAFVIGIVLCSGSLQLMAATAIRWLDAITPVGGIALIAGWALMAWRVSRTTL